MSIIPYNIGDLLNKGLHKINLQKNKNDHQITTDTLSTKAFNLIQNFNLMNLTRGIGLFKRSQSFHFPCLHNSGILSVIGFSLLCSGPSREFLNSIKFLFFYKCQISFLPKKSVNTYV